MKQINPIPTYNDTRWKTYVSKMRGGNIAAAPNLSIKALLVTALGSFLGIGFIAILAEYYQLPFLVPSFGATAVLLYAACHVPMAQPRNVVGGHAISALVSVMVYQTFGNTWWAIALGVTLAIVAMSITYTLHPPEGPPPLWPFIPDRVLTLYLLR